LTDRGPAFWADSLPDFPWDLLAPYARRARRHPDGMVDLSVGTPVDPVPEVVQAAVRGCLDTPGYPATHGTPRLRAAAAGWLARRLGVTVPAEAVLPTIGSKELVSLLPLLLGARPGARVLHPALAYPSYDVGARLAGCQPVPADRPPADGAGVALVWLNSPANPTGVVLPPAAQRGWVSWGRQFGVPVVADECYIELGWETVPVSLLHPSVCGGSHAGLLAVHSLSKRSNLAGYRAGILTGDPRLVAGLLAVRRHAGLMVPEPVQAAMVAAFDDDAHAAEQRQRYAARRARLRSALGSAGFAIEHSEAGLYLWASRGEDCWASVDWLAGHGILVAPGSFYGSTGGRHVRVALTATDERVAAAAARLAAPLPG
jgi:succinyldiaminopimelate transaminase